MIHGLKIAFTRQEIVAGIDERLEEVPALIQYMQDSTTDFLLCRGRTPRPADPPPNRDFARFAEILPTELHGRA